MIQQYGKTNGNTRVIPILLTEALDSISGWEGGKGSRTLAISYISEEIILQHETEIVSKLTTLCICLYISLYIIYMVGD